MIELLLIMMGGVALWGFGRALRWMVDDPDPKSAFSDLPLTPMAESEDYRLVKVQGRVKAKGALLQSPLTGTPCIGYRIETEEWLGEHGRYAHEVSVDELVPDFLVDDGTACASVTGAGALLLLDKRLIQDDSAHRQAIDGLLARAGRKRDDALTYLCRESLLVEGQSVVVRATARWIEREGGLREPPTRTLELRATTVFPVLIGEPRDVKGS